jgi:hypothetical protein
MNILRWAAIPVVLIASPLSGMAGGYEPLVNALVCMSAIILVQRAALLQQYVSGAGFIAIAVLFGPFHLAIKIFLLLGLACIAAFSAVLAGFRMHPSPAVCLAP